MRTASVAAGFAIAILLPCSRHLTGADVSKPIDEAYALGENAFAKREYARAVGLFSAAIQGSPANPRAYLARAKAYASGGDLNAAIADCCQATKLDATCTAAFLLRGAANLSRGVDKAAFADLDAAVRSAPGYEQGYAVRGLALMLRGKYDQAAADFDRAIVLNPRSAAARCNRGGANLLAGRIKGAKVDFDAAIRLDPRLAEAYVNRALAYWASGHGENAVADLTMAIDLDAGSAELRCLRAWIYAGLGRTSNALADCDEAIRIDPQHVDAHVLRGKVMNERAHWAGAFADFSEALRLDPKCGGAYRERGLSCLASGKVQKALADWNKAVEFDAEDADALALRGYTHWSRQEIGDGVRDVKAAIFLDPDCNFLPRVDQWATAASTVHGAPVVFSSEPVTYGPVTVNASYNEFIALCFYLPGVKLETMNHDRRGALNAYALALQMNPALVEARLRRARLLMTQERGLDDVGWEGVSGALGLDLLSLLYERARILRNLQALDEFNVVIATAPSIRAGYIGRADAEDRLGRHDAAHCDRQTASRLTARNDGKRPVVAPVALAFGMGESFMESAMDRWRWALPPAMRLRRRGGGAGLNVAKLRFGTCKSPVSEGLERDTRENVPRRAGTTHRGEVRDTFPWADRERAIIVPVTVAENEYPFILDTGCSLTVFDDEFASQLGKPLDRKACEAIRVVDASGHAMKVYGGAPFMRLGSFVLPARGPVLCTDLTRMRRSFGQDFYGFLGLGQLNGLIIQVSYDDARVSVLHGLPAERSLVGHGMPMVHGPGPSLLVGGIASGEAEAEFLLDTAYMGNGTIDKSLETRLAARGQFKELFAGFAEGLHGPFPSIAGRLETFSVGAFQHHGLRFDTYDFNIIGLDYLRRYRFTLDFVNDRLYLCKGSRFVTVDFPEPVVKRNAPTVQLAVPTQILLADEFQLVAPTESSRAGGSRATLRNANRIVRAYIERSLAILGIEVSLNEYQTFQSTVQLLVVPGYPAMDK